MFIGAHFLFLVLILNLWTVPSSAVFVEFHNCLSERIRNDQPLALQLVPQFVNVIFNTTSPDHNLNVTVWVNVTGSTVGPAPRSILPPANDTNYWNGNNTESGGKIEDIPYPDIINKQTTLYNSVKFLNYQPFSEYVSFCEFLANGTCPLGPVWSPHNSSVHIPENYPYFGFSYNPYSTYALGSLDVLLKVKYGNKDASEIGCISFNITPDIGSKLAEVIKFSPLIVLIFVGFSILFAAIWSPWGTSDIFHWTTNYGRDPDLLRLMTPGFGDCLQYIQFITLTAGLKINYPGFYQPIVSKFAWSILIFNYNFFQNSTSTGSLVDGIHITHGNYGLEKISELIGIAQIDNLWNSLVISLLVIIAISVTTIQIGFLLRWINRKLNNIHEEDLRAKNLPFTIGNVIRIIFNYFLLPLVTFSLFQLLVASQSPTHTVGLAVLMLFFISGLAIWLLKVIITIKPKSLLFDEFRIVLLLGSLYSTYSDHAPSFTAIPIALTFVRGIAIGAIQVSGIAQIVVLAICEIITLLTIHGFRPFQHQTSMNAYHISFATARLTILLLMISFVPSLDVSEGFKGWVGYAILLIHSMVLMLGFLLNSVQTIVEVSARLAGAGDEGGQARGGFAETFCMQQLSSILPHNDQTLRQSQSSNVAMLDSGQRNSLNGRIRSQSASSVGILLGRRSLMTDRNNVDKFVACQQGSGPTPINYSAYREAYAFCSLPSASTILGTGQNQASFLGLDTSTNADPYFRAPRFRRPASESITQTTSNREFWNGEKWINEDAPDDIFEPVSGISLKSGRSSPHLNSAVFEEISAQPKADYTTREVDFYYRVNGSGSNTNISSRRAKANQVDFIVSTTSAPGWFKWITSSKTKDKGKGFEVIRGSRLPPVDYHLNNS